MAAANASNAARDPTPWGAGPAPPPLGSGRGYLFAHAPRVEGVHVAVLPHLVDVVFGALGAEHVHDAGAQTTGMTSSDGLPLPGVGGRDAGEAKSDL